MGLLNGLLSGRWLRVPKRAWADVAGAKAWERWAVEPLGEDRMSRLSVALLHRPDRWTLNEARMDGDVIVGVFRWDARRPNRVEYRTRCQKAKVWQKKGGAAKEERETIWMKLMAETSPSTSLVEWAWDVPNGRVWLGSAGARAVDFWMGPLLTQVLDLGKGDVIKDMAAPNAGFLRWLLEKKLAGGAGAGGYALVEQIVIEGDERVAVHAGDVLDSRALAGPLLNGAGVERLTLEHKTRARVGLTARGAWANVRLTTDKQRAGDDSGHDVMFYLRWSELTILLEWIEAGLAGFAAALEDAAGLTALTALAARARTVLEHVPMQGTLMDAVREARRARRPVGALAAAQEHVRGVTEVATGGKTLTIDINMDAACAECGEKGAAQNGLCLGCTNKALNGKGRVKSGPALAVRKIAIERASSAGR